MKDNLHLRKQQNTQTSLSQDKLKQKKLLLFHLEIDGEERICLKNQEIKLLLKICQFKALLVVVKLKLLEDQRNQQKHLSQGFKPQNTLKQAMLEKMLALQLKIRTLFKLNLAKIGISNYKQKHEKLFKQMSEKIKNQVYLQILDALIGSDWRDKDIEKQKLESLKKGLYDDQLITVLPGWHSQNLVALGLQPPFPPQRPLTKTVKQIYSILYSVYHDKLKHSYSNVDITKQALKNVQQQGIVYLDQIDKLITPQNSNISGKGVSTEGVQRDLLPIIEGTVINTKFGQIKTDHILFIASGSFSMAKVQELLPQLLGRLPIRVSLQPITLQQFYRILTEPEYNLLMQQTNLLKAQNVDLQFETGAVRQMAQYAFQLNQNTQNIGARRLHAIVEKVLQDISFQAPEIQGQSIVITKDYVIQKVQKMTAKINLAKYLI